MAVKDTNIKYGNSIKDYYIKLERMHVNVMNMLTALNQSLVTNSSEISVTIADSDDVSQTMRIPSFLYLENKLEELDNNFGTLFNMPKSGEAWFTKNSSDTYRMNMVRSNTALPSPKISTDTSTGLVASLTDNNILKDMVCPKTYIRYNIENMADLTNSIVMKKFVFFNTVLFNAIQSAYNNNTYNSYADFTALLDGYIIGTDYEVYESTLTLPIKKDTFVSEFRIVDVIYNSNENINLTLSTLQYYDAEDSSLVYYLKKGDRLVYSDTSTEYEVVSVGDDNKVVLSETGTHVTLETYEENNANVLYIVNKDYNSYKYVDVPLEENEHIAVSLAVVYNNIRSNWSSPEVIDLNSVPMTDESGNKMTDASGNEMSYIDYYNKYCNNIGDLILGITECAYPQVSNFSTSQLSSLQDGADVGALVNSSISNDILKVVPINKHLTDDATNDEIISLHQQKNELSSQLSTIQNNINTVTTKLMSLSQNSGDSQSSLQNELTGYYNERTSLTKQFNACVDKINEKSAALSKVQDKVKYRVRGLCDTNTIISTLKENYGDKVELVGTEIWYKYKSINSDTSTLTTINSDTFTEWNIQKPEQRGRYLSFNSLGTGFVTEYVDYTSTDNIPKWNQVDIPIKNGEDVILKVRFIYNIGLPFIELTTPWSDELTITFPEEYKEDVEVSSIIDTNNDDTVTASFSSKLINDGYEDHINDKTVSNSDVFYHTASHIYSEFNTAENNMLSLKDKLDDIVSDINNYKELLDDAKQSKIKVSVVIDGNETELSDNVTNTINIYNTNNLNSKFIKKTFNLVIKNVSDYNVHLYSLFPGNITIPLPFTDINTRVNTDVANYERVPLQVSGKATPQYQGQWIYFRGRSPFTNSSIYYETDEQNYVDITSCLPQKESDTKFIEPKFSSSLSNYMAVDNLQCQLPYRYRQEIYRNTDNISGQINCITNALVAIHEFLTEYGDSVVE